MAQTLEELVLRLTMDSRRLQRELRTVQTKNRQAATRMGKVWERASAGMLVYTKRLISTRGALLAIGAATGTGFAIKRTLDFADAIEKTAGKLGITTDALQEFRFAADQSGVPIRTVEMGLQRFTRRAAEAANGTGEARDAIAELGIELRDANGNIRATEELFRDAMAALAEIESPADRLRLAFKLFDSEGAVLVNMADNFSTLSARARELGAVMDEHTIKRAAEAKGQLDAMMMVTRAQLIPALAALAPALIQSAKGLAEVAKFAALVWARFTDIRNLGVEQVERRIQEVTEAYEEAQERLQQQIRDLAAGGMLERDVFALSSPQIEIVQRLSAELSELYRRREELGQLEQTLPPIVPPVSEIEPSTEALKDYGEAIETVAVTAEKKADEIEQAWTGLQGDLADGFAQLAIDGEASFEAIGKAFLREVVATILRTQVLNTVFSVIGGLGGGGLGGAFSGLGGGAFPHYGGSGIISAIPRHSGGPVSPGRSYLVGERGPELIMPRAQGTVIPSQAMGGGGEVSVVIHNYSGKPVETEQNQGPSKKELEVFIGRTGAKSVMGGGPMDQAIQRRYGIKPTGYSGA